MAGYTPVIGAQAKFGLFAGLEATTATLLRFYVLHVLFLPLLLLSLWLSISGELEKMAEFQDLCRDLW